MSSEPDDVAICHDYLTQRGGAERVVLTLAEAFDRPPIHTALFEPRGTYPEFAELDVRPGPLDRIAAVRQHHRWSLPLMAWSFGRVVSDADVTVCSSSGWAHGVSATGRKVVYCHSPARWLYRPDNYLEHFGQGARLALRGARRWLLSWDQAAMQTADVIVANSTTIAHQVGEVYGRECEVVPPSSPLMNPGPVEDVHDLAPNFVLCVSRLLGYKHLDLLIDVARMLSHRHFVVVGDGPHEEHLVKNAPSNIRWMGVVDDARLRWCYQNCDLLLSTSEEDFGLTPLEAAAYGRPSVVPRSRGYLDHVAERVTGLFHDGSRERCSEAIEETMTRVWDTDQIVAQSRLFGSDVFVKQMQSIVDELR